MKTIKDILKLSEEYLKNHDIQNSRLQAETMVSDVLK